MADHLDDIMAAASAAAQQAVSDSAALDRAWYNNRLDEHLASIRVREGAVRDTEEGKDDGDGDTGTE